MRLGYVIMRCNSRVWGLLFSRYIAHRRMLLLCRMNRGSFINGDWWLLMRMACWIKVKLIKIASVSRKVLILISPAPFNPKHHQLGWSNTQISQLYPLTLKSSHYYVMHLKDTHKLLLVHPKSTKNIHSLVELIQNFLHCHSKYQ